VPPSVVVDAALLIQAIVHDAGQTSKSIQIPWPARDRIAAEAVPLASSGVEALRCLGFENRQRPRESVDQGAGDRS